jgi:uncharacterized membrane protein YkoI
MKDERDLELQQELEKVNKQIEEMRAAGIEIDFDEDLALEDFEDEAPEVIQEAFDELFDDVLEVEWEEGDDQTWEADFTYDGVEMEVTFDAAGKILEKETTIPIHAVTEAAKKAIYAAYPGSDLLEAELVERADGSIVFEVAISFELHITPDGKIVKQGDL